MVAYAVEDTQSSVEKCLLQANRLSVDLTDVNECFGVPDPFGGLRTEYMQSKYYRENFNLVVSFLLLMHDH